MLKKSDIQAVISGQGIVMPTAETLRAAHDEYDARLAADGRQATRMTDTRLALYLTIVHTLQASAPIPAAAYPGKARPNARQIGEAAAANPSIRFVDLDWRHLADEAGSVQAAVHNVFGRSERPSPIPDELRGRVVHKAVQRTDVLRFALV